jgi:hypothetical protein
MDNMRPSLHTRVHHWIDQVGFHLNSSNKVAKDNTTVDHYFFETFNFIEKIKPGKPDTATFVCFDTYGEKVKVKSLLDLQTAFFENVHQLK